MGTHPIFESDFDCLTDIKTEVIGGDYSFLERCLNSSSMSAPERTDSTPSEEQQWPINPYMNPQLYGQDGQNAGMQFAWGQNFDPAAAAGLPMPSGLPGLPGALPGGYPNPWGAMGYPQLPHATTQAKSEKSKKKEKSR